MLVFMGSLLLGVVLGHGGDSALDHFNAEVVRRNAELDGVVFDGGDDAAHATGGGDAVAGFELAEHVLPGTLLLLLRTDEQEVEDDDDEQEWKHPCDTGRQGKGSQRSDEGQRAVLLAGRKKAVCGAKRNQFPRKGSQERVVFEVTTASGSWIPGKGPWQERTHVRPCWRA